MERALNGLPVIFSRFLTNESISRAYASANLFIFAGSSDTFENVVLEALESGLPVIVLDAGGPQEIAPLVPRPHISEPHTGPEGGGSVEVRCGSSRVLFHIVAPCQE